ncbi:hypothetical protein Hanom_Chr08g00696871 [Helianthus anomalus]
MELKTGRPGYGIDVWGIHPMATRTFCFQNYSLQMEKQIAKPVFVLKAIDNRLN